MERKQHNSNILTGNLASAPNHAAQQLKKRASEGRKRATTPPAGMVMQHFLSVGVVCLCGSKDTLSRLEGV